MRALIETLLRLAAEDAARFTKARQRNMALYGLAALAGLTAYACGVVAAVLWIARHHDPVLAAGVVAVAFAALALTVLMVVALLNRRERLQWQHRRAVYTRSAGAMLGTLAGPAGQSLIVAVLLAALVRNGPSQQP